MNEGIHNFSDGEKLMLARGAHRGGFKRIYFSQLMQRADSLGKTLMLGKTEGRRRRRQRMRWLNGMINSMNMSISKFWEILKDREA